MALLNTNSCECLKSELDLTSVPPIETAIEVTRYEKYYPLTSLSGSGPIEFLTTSGEEDYLDLQNSFLYIKHMDIHYMGRTFPKIAVKIMKGT